MRWCTSATNSVYYCKHWFQYCIASSPQNLFRCCILSCFHIFRYACCFTEVDISNNDNYETQLIQFCFVTVPISIYVFTLPLPYLGVASSLPTGFVAGAIVLVFGLLVYAWTPSNGCSSSASFSEAST